MKKAGGHRTTGTRAGHLILLACVVGMLLGCQGPPPSPPEVPRRIEQGAESRLRTGDAITIHFDTGSTRVAAPQTVSTVIDEKGEISLALVGAVKAEGLTPSELGSLIESLYVPRYYVRCNVTVTAGKRAFYVGGEVRRTGRYEWEEDISLLKAIHIAGSFTEYANQRRVEVTRGNKKFIVDVEEARRDPSKDLPILPGDTIWIPRSVW